MSAPVTEILNFIVFQFFGEIARDKFLVIIKI